MMTVELKKPGLVCLTIDGDIDAENMDVVLDEMIRITADVKNGKMLYTIRNFEMPSLSAIAVEIRKIPSLFSMVMKFDRIAVLSDENWLKTAATVEGFFIPGLEILTFNLDEEAEALAFLEGAESTVG